MLNSRVVCTPDWSVARAVNGNVPAVAGVPEITPEPLRDRPGGSCPATTDQLYGRRGTGDQRRCDAEGARHRQPRREPSGDDPVLDGLVAARACREQRSAVSGADVAVRQGVV